MGFLSRVSLVSDLVALLQLQSDCIISPKEWYDVYDKMLFYVMLPKYIKLICVSFQAIGLTMVPRGESVWRATLYSVLSSLPQPLLSVPAFLLVEQFQLFLPIGLGLAAGAMMWLVLCELVPESLEHISLSRFLSLFSMSMCAMWGLGHALHFLQDH